MLQEHDHKPKKSLTLMLIHWVNPVQLPMYLSTRGNHDLALNTNSTLCSGVGSPRWCKDEGYQPCAADSGAAPTRGREDYHRGGDRRCCRDHMGS